MKIKQIGSNQTQVHTNSKEYGEMTILYSYETPVAIKVLSTGQVYQTTRWFSKTTSRHLNKWTLFVPEVSMNYVSQPNIEAMIQS